MRRKHDDHNNSIAFEGVIKPKPTVLGFNRVQLADIQTPYAVDKNYSKLSQPVEAINFQRFTQDFKNESPRRKLSDVRVTSNVELQSRFENSFAKPNYASPSKMDVIFFRD